MRSKHISLDDLQWLCHRCDCRLEVGPVTVAYMGNRFTTDLPYCPRCKRVLISEQVATGKMAEVEQLLEDK